MTERDDAIKLANRILDRIHADPDDDRAVLARQFLRSNEIIEKVEDECDQLKILVQCHEASLDGALAALAGAGICTPEETFKRAPSGSLGTCIRNLRDERDKAEDLYRDLDIDNQDRMKIATDLASVISEIMQDPCEELMIGVKYAQRLREAENTWRELGAPGAGQVSHEDI